MTTFQRYMAYQVPGWAATIAAGWLAHEWFELPLWAGAGVLLLLVIKDFALYPWLKVGYRTAASSGREALIGASAVVTQALTPEGMVKVKSELWKARSAEPGEKFEAGEAVVVAAMENMTVLVARTSVSAPRAEAQ